MTVKQVRKSVFRIQITPLDCFCRIENTPRDKTKTRGFVTETLRNITFNNQCDTRERSVYSLFRGSLLDPDDRTLSLWGIGVPKDQDPFDLVDKGIRLTLESLQGPLSTSGYLTGQGLASGEQRFRYESFLEYFLMRNIEEHWKAFTNMQPEVVYNQYRFGPYDDHIDCLLLSPRSVDVIELKVDRVDAGKPEEPVDQVARYHRWVVAQKPLLALQFGLDLSNAKVNYHLVGARGARNVDPGKAPGLRLYEYRVSDSMLVMKRVR